MPTKKRRVGFIPRSEVFELINKLSYKSNLSYSKIINILVEEALHRRGLLNLNNAQIYDENPIPQIKNELQETKKIINQEFNYNFNNKLLNYEDLNSETIKEEPIDNEIYAKFLMFLKFQERMKKK